MNSNKRARQTCPKLWAAHGKYAPHRTLRVKVGCVKHAFQRKTTTCSDGKELKNFSPAELRWRLFHLAVSYLLWHFCHGVCFLCDFSCKFHKTIKRSSDESKGRRPVPITDGIIHLSGRAASIENQHSVRSTAASLSGITALTRNEIFRVMQCKYVLSMDYQRKTFPKSYLDGEMARISTLNQLGQMALWYPLDWE